MGKIVRARAELKKLSPNASQSEKNRAFEKLKRDFKRAVQYSRVLHDYKKYEFFTRPCDERRSKDNRRLQAARQEFSEDPLNKKENNKNGEKRNQS